MLVADQIFSDDVQIVDNTALFNVRDIQFSADLGDLYFVLGNSQSATIRTCEGWRIVRSGEMINLIDDNDSLQLISTIYDLAFTL